MKEGEVVYWPRHLWTSTGSSAVHLPPAVCKRWSRDVLCVVALELQQVPDGLEVLLSTKNSHKFRHIVLFDAQVAALGDFETLHSPHLLQQIGEQFAARYKHEKGVDADRRGTIRTTTWLLETVGYYALYVPFAALMVVTTAVYRIVHDVHFPLWFLIGGGKSVAVRAGPVLTKDAGCEDV